MLAAGCRCFWRLGLSEFYILVLHYPLVNPASLTATLQEMLFLQYELVVESIPTGEHK